MNNNTYPIIKVKNAQTQEVVMGWLIGEWLIVTRTKSWEIWNKKGETLFRNIDSDSDAIELAEWLNTTYSSYFPIWQEYPEIDIFSISKWGIVDGTRKFELIEHLRTCPRISMKVVLNIFETCTGRKYYQKYMKEYQV